MKTIFTFLLVAGLAYGQGSGTALQFDGNDEVRTAGINLLGTSNDFSLSLWVNPGGSQLAYADIIDWDHGLPDYGNFVIQQENLTLNTYRCFFFSSSSSTSGNATVPVNLQTGVWQHLAFVKDGSQFHAFLDGVLVGTTTVNSTVFAFNATLTLGGNSDAFTRYFNGQLDEVAIYNTALSASEVRARMCETLVGTEPGLVAYYRMDEGMDNLCGSGADVCDASGNGNHGTKF